MPTVNKRVLLRLFAVTLALVVGLVVLHSVQAGRIPEALRWQAEHAAAQGKLDKAIYYSRQYLEFRPDDHDAALQLGELLLKRGGSQKELSNVLFLYERITREAPDRADVRRQLVELCIRINRSSDALIHLEALLDKHADDAQLWEQAGVCHAAQNRPGEARRAFEKAVQLNPARVAAYDLLAQLLAGPLNQPDAAQACLERMVASNAANAEAFLLRARFWKSANKLAECLKDVERFLELSPEHPDGLLLSAEVLQGRGDIARARQTLTAAVELYPRDVRLYRSLSWLEVCLGNVPGAVACLEQGTKELPQAVDLVTPLADLLIQQNELERAGKLLERLKSTRAPASQVQYLNGRLLMQQGQWAEAIAVLEPLRTEAVSLPGLTAQLNQLLSICQEHVGNREAQAEALQRVLTIDPSHLGARLALGNRYVGEGRWDDAIKEYAVAAASPFAALGVHTTLGRLRIAKARSVSAPAGEWADIEAFTTQLRQRFRTSAEPVVLMAELYAARGEFDRAAKLLRDEAGRKLNDPRLWVALANVVEQADGQRAALEVLDEAHGILGEQSELRLARGQLWARDPALRQAGRLRDLEHRFDELGDAEQLRLLAGLADLYANLRDPDSLKRIYRLLAARRPRDVAVRAALAQELSADDEAEERARVEGEIERLEGDTGLTVTLLALLRSGERANPGDATFQRTIERVREIVNAHSDRADAHFALARLAERSGDAPTAGRHLALAVEHDRSNLRYVREQIVFLLKHGPEQTARQLLERLYYDPRLTPQRFQALLEASLMSVPDDAAKKCLAWLAPHVGKDCRRLLWLGAFLAQSKRAPEALAVFRKAVAAAPTLPDAWTGLLLALARDKNEIGWQIELDRARTALSPEKFYLVCALCSDAFRGVKPAWQPRFESAGDRRLYVQASVELMLNRGERQRAAEVLEQVVADSASRSGDVIWAKQSLAMLAIQGGSADEARVALQAVVKAPAPPGASLPDRRGHVALLLAAYRHLPDADRRTALNDLVATLQAIATDASATTKDWFLLAQLQHQGGDREGYRRSLGELMRREPDNLFYVCAHVDQLLSDNDLKTAEVEVTKLQQAVHDLRAAASVARFYCLTNTPSRALEAVDLFIQAADPATPEAAGRIRQAAGLLDQLARLAAERAVPSAPVFAEAALAKYRATVRQFPDETEPFAALLGYLNQCSAALEVIQQCQGQLSPRALAAGGLAVLRTGNANPRQFQVVKQWVDLAVADKAGSIGPQLQLAEYHALRQDFAAAEEVYRAILRADPNHVVALNNLAWVLAARPDKAAEALGLVERAMRVTGATGELLDTRARILIAAGKYDRAVDDLTDALHQSPTSLRYFHLAMARLKQAKRDDALEAFKKAKARGLDPKAIHPSDLPAYKVFTSELGS